MRFAGKLLLLLPALTLLFSCEKSLNVNADWKDITVVYGILDQTQDTTFIKVTKAFLGAGDAMQFAKIPDSSYYRDSLSVTLDEYSGETFKRTIQLGITTVHNKLAGDSVFYFPDQVLYYTKARLNQNYSYQLMVKNLNTGKEVTAKTILLHNFDVVFPLESVTYMPGKPFRVKWEPAYNGKRYQLLIRVFYSETMNSGSSSIRSFDWLVFNYIKPASVTTTAPFDLYLPGDAFYTQVGNKIKRDPNVKRRSIFRCDYIFTSVATDLDTYIDVNAPSLGLVQEKPAFTNITNGIGLFSARIVKPVDSLIVTSYTQNELAKMYDTLGFQYP